VVDCVGPVGAVGQLKLGVNAGVRSGIEAAGVVAEETPVTVCCGTTGADVQVISGGLTLEDEVRTSRADEDTGIDLGADVGVGANEEPVRNVGAVVAFVGNDRSDFAGAASVPEAAFCAASVAAAAPNPFHVPVGGVDNPTGLLVGKESSTSGAHLKTGVVAAGAEVTGTEVVSGLEAEPNGLGPGVNG
jgi:hypothetical protein